MKKIEALTPEQKARFPEFVRKWLNIGLCTEPADRENAEKAIVQCYEIAGLKRPDKIIWCESPLSMAITHSILKEGSVGDIVRGSVWDSVRDSVGGSVGDSVRESVRESVGGSVRGSVWKSVVDSVRGSVWKSVRASVGDSVWDSVGKSVGKSVWDSVGGSVGDSVRESVRESVVDSVRGSVRGSVGDSVGDSVRESVGGSVYGQHDAHWLAFYDYFREACFLTKQTEKLSGVCALAQSAGWWIPCKNICLVSERHNICKLDDRGLIHCEDGPAIEYPDGFAVYAWRGTRIPEKWVTGEPPTAVEALTWGNLEQRRAACEIVGWVNILRNLNASTIDKDGDPQIGELLEVDIPDVGREKFLRVECGTKREFALPVPPEMQTAIEAQCWINNVPEDAIRQLEVRT